MNERTKALIEAGKNIDKFEKEVLPKFKDKRPFYRTKLDEEKATEKGKIFTIRLNDEEIKQLKADMKLLRQVKPSTTIKQLWRVGRTVLHDDKTGSIIRIVLGNFRRNERTGIVEPDVEIEQI